VLRDQLSHLDVVFLAAESPSTPMHTAGVVIFDGPLPFQKVYEVIESRLHLVPRFSQRIVEVPFGLAHPYWADDPEFDLAFHVRHSALPAPGSDEELCAFAARLVSRPLDRSKPLWELYVIDGLEGDRSAMLIKTHHAMVDGVSSMDLATALFDFGPEPSQPPPPKELRKPEPLPNRAQLLQKVMTQQARGLLDLGGLLGAAAAAPRRVAERVAGGVGLVASSATSLLRPAGPSPLNTGPGLHRRFAIVRSTLQTIKDIKNAAGTTVNDVVLTVCADSLGKLFRARDEPTEGRSLRVMVPVSVRSEDHRMQLGNEITAVFCDLPIGKMRPLDRLRIVHNQIKDVKDSRQALAADLLVNLTRWSPPTLHALSARLATRGRWMNTIISNVPGPQIPLYSCGVKMLEPYAVIPLAPGQSLAFGVTSYNGEIFFGLNADRDSHPDLAQLARYVEESIKDLEKAAAEVSSESVTPADTSSAVGGEQAP
jgi:diacylglycerol O-acyltransferase